VLASGPLTAAIGHLSANPRWYKLVVTALILGGAKIFAQISKMFIISPSCPDLNEAHLLSTNLNESVGAIRLRRQAIRGLKSNRQHIESLKGFR